MVSRAPTPLRIDRAGHQVATSAAGSLDLTVLGGGLMLGHSGQQPAMERVLTASGRRLAVVGGRWLTGVLLVRLLGLGAVVVVRTRGPQQWEALGRAATGEHGRVWWAAGTAAAPAGSPERPVVVLSDQAGDPYGAPQVPRAPWQLQLTVVPAVTTRGLEIIADSDLVLFQRLSPPETAAIRQVLRLATGAFRAVQELRPDQVLTSDLQGARLVQITPTSIELALVGPPPHRGTGRATVPMPPTSHPPH